MREQRVCVGARRRLVGGLGLLNGSRSGGLRLRDGNVRRRRVAALEEIVRPREEILPVRCVGVSAVVLAPRELPVEQADVHRRHLLGHIVVGHAEVLGAEQSEDGLRGDGGHVAALVVEPLRVALLGHAVADERQPRRAERDQLVRIDRQIAGVLAAEGRRRTRRT